MISQSKITITGIGEVIVVFKDEEQQEIFRKFFNTLMPKDVVIEEIN